ncbi:MAG: cytochrome c-type biogenesis protein CcmH [Acidimicrobiia bacterium]|nr:cytochrome c-type biogenesis protein CcmH [Acidimicrobiia bacterium]
MHWLVLGFIVIGALIIGTRSTGPSSQEDKVQAIARTIKCPECEGQSVATSGSASSKAIRVDIGARLRRGQSADEIRDYYAAHYGEAILLTPARSGAASLVWIIPVVAIVIAIAALAAAFVRWRSAADGHATDEDRALVAAALADPHGEGSGR